MKDKRNLFSIYLILNTVEAVAAAYWLASLPADIKNVFAFGISFHRLLLIIGMLVLGIINLIGFVQLRKMRIVLSKFTLVFSNHYTLTLLVILFVGSWILLFLPEYRWGGLGGYKSRLFPYLIWFLMVGFQSLLLTIHLQRGGEIHSLKTIVMNENPTIKKWRLVLCCLSLAFIVILITKIGLEPDIVYWNNNNVPLLGTQIFAIFVFSSVLFSLLPKLIFSRYVNSQTRQILIDILLFILIWGIAAILWTQTSGPRSFFAPGPYPPNGERYPFSDAAGYDMAAQLASIGEGLGTKTYVDKPLYVAFLTVIYLIADTNTQMANNLQVIFVALFPAVVFLIGKASLNRLAGFLAAGMVIFREINNINSTLWILSANSQVMMTESLVCLLLTFSVISYMLWIKNPQKRYYLMATGGWVGLSCLTRLNPFLLVPVVLVTTFLYLWKKWKQAFISCGIFIIFFASAVLPWMLQSYTVHNNFIFFTSTVRWVVLPQRSFYALKPTPVATIESNSTLQTPVQKDPNKSSIFESKTWTKIAGISKYVANHFVHNIVSSLAVFPTRLNLDSLEVIINSPGSFWSTNGIINLPKNEIVLLWINVAIISFGLVASWERSRWVGMVPVGFLLAYSLATSVARTSGGRYILPADWVSIVYYGVGLSQIYLSALTWWKGKKQDQETNFSPKDLILTKKYEMILGTSLLISFVVIGGLPVILDRYIPQRYESWDKKSLVEEMEKKNLLKNLPINKEDLIAFVDSPNTIVTQGIGLYPRFYEMDKGEPDQYSGARSLPYPRLVMTVVGTDIVTTGILPISKSPKPLPNRSDVTVIGCSGELNDDWFAIIVESPQKQLLLRQPMVEWTCPSKPPICDNNRNCR